MNVRHWVVQFTVQSLGGGGSRGSTVMIYSKLQSSGRTAHSRLNCHWLAPTFTIVDSDTVRVGIKDGGPVDAHE